MTVNFKQHMVMSTSEPSQIFRLHFSARIQNNELNLMSLLKDTYDIHVLQLKS